MRAANKSNKIIISPAARVGIVAARFNSVITDQILESAMSALRDCRVAEKNIRLISVAGSVELPLALQRLAKNGKFDCLLALGCIIRGETSHYDFVCKIAADGILRVSLENDVPIGFGVLTVDNLKQAEARVDIGRGAVLAALELAKI